MTAFDITTIEASVEALIRQQVAAYEAQLREALARTLATPRSASSRRTASRPKAAPKRSAARERPRAPEELEALAELFFAAVEAAPGETMMTHAAKLGLRTQELRQPVLRLKQAGRIKSVGEQHRTRYYPMTPSTT
jgi:hypothetical protein